MAKFAIISPRPILSLCAIACLAASGLTAAEYHGQVTFNGLPVPGATVTATQDGRKAVTITDRQGSWSFPDLTDGACHMEVEMYQRVIMS